MSLQDLLARNQINSMRSWILILAQRMRSFLTHLMLRQPESMEEAISKFMEGMERQESSGFQNINRLIHNLSVPEQKANRCITHADAIE